MKQQNFPRLAGKVVLVTGAWGGLGKTFIRHLLASRAKIILSDIAEKPIAQLAEGGGLPTGWENLILGQIVADLNAPEGPQTLYDACKKIAPVDMIIHNAGLAFVGHYEEIPREKMNLQMRVMLTAPMELTHLFLPDFLQRGSGHLVFIDSVAGFIATKLGTSYSAAKFGLRGFAMALSGEIKARGVDVTIIYPFFTRTGILKAPIIGKAKIPVMPSIFIDDPDKVINTALKGIDKRVLHVKTGFYSNFMWQVTRIWPVISSQMQPKKI